MSNPDEITQFPTFPIFCPVVYYLVLGAFKNVTLKFKGTAANYVGIALQDSIVLPKLTTKILIPREKLTLFVNKLRKESVLPFFKTFDRHMSKMFD